MLEKMIIDLKKVMPFKQTTIPGDVVLIVGNDPPSLSYAVVESIERDVTRRDEWWHVAMQLLAVPPQRITWTLREAQFTGQEVFTMGGEERFVKAVDLKAGGPATPPVAKIKNSGQPGKRPQLRVIK